MFQSCRRQLRARHLAAKRLGHQGPLGPAHAEIQNADSVRLQLEMLHDKLNLLGPIAVIQECIQLVQSLPLGGWYPNLINLIRECLARDRSLVCELAGYAAHDLIFESAQGRQISPPLVVAFKEGSQCTSVERLFCYRVKSDRPAARTALSIHDDFLGPFNHISSRSTVPASMS